MYICTEIVSDGRETEEGQESDVHDAMAMIEDVLAAVCV
jgi:hypothetical protein